MENRNENNRRNENQRDNQIGNSNQNGNGNQNGNQKENGKLALTVDFYDPNMEQKRRLDYDYWLQYHSSQSQSPQYLQQLQQQQQQQQALLSATGTVTGTGTAVTEITAATKAEIALKKLESTKNLEFSSVLKLTSVVLLCTFLSYISVSPRNLPLIEYNSAYKETLLRVLCSLLWPVLLIIKVKSEKDDINKIIGLFIKSFTFGYIGVVFLETVAVTIMRLVILRYAQ